MPKSFKREINPTPGQKVKINKTIGTCRYVYDFYPGCNEALHEKGEKFMAGKRFSVWLNNEYIPNDPDKAWIKEVYSKAVMNSIENGCIAFTGFFKNQSAFPDFREKGKADVRMYFVTKMSLSQVGEFKERRVCSKEYTKLKVQKLHHRIDNIRTDYISNSNFPHRA